MDFEKRKKSAEKRLNSVEHVSPVGDVTKPHIAKAKFDVKKIDVEAEQVSAKEFWYGRKPRQRT
jgi:hypothetical protein